jgi:hypothetical protein
MNRCRRVAFDKLRLSGGGLAVGAQNPLMLSLSKHTREVAS